MSTVDCLIVFSPLLALVTLMFVGFAYVHFLDNRP
jgi:hypothetical protein